MAHVTGGGIEGNLPRVLPDGARRPDRRGALAGAGLAVSGSPAAGVAADELRRVFNCGVGYLVVVPPRPMRDARHRDGAAARHAGVDRSARSTAGQGVRFA